MATSQDIGFAMPGFDWNVYMKFRPTYPESLFSRIYEYHKQHCDRWESVHDAGSGAGIVAGRLAERFDTVAVSDPNGEYLNVARERLKRLQNSKEKFIFHQATAEDQSWLDADSLDMFTIFTAIGYVKDRDMMMRQLSRVLRPGGTFVSVHYNSWPAIIDNPEAAAAWSEFASLWVTKGIKEGSANTKRAFRVFWGGVDGIELPRDIFEDGAMRIKINEKQRVEADKVRQFPEYGFLPSVVRDTDLMVEEENIDEWTRDYTLAELKSLVGTLADIPESSEIAPTWERMEQTMQDSQQKTLRMLWSTQVILATRRKT